MSRRLTLTLCGLGLVAGLLTGCERPPIDTVQSAPSPSSVRT